MKTTGIVRRIDELGRIVIPKEIRKTMRIKEGEELEIYISGEDTLVLRKYSPVKTLSRLGNEYAEVLYQNTGYTCIICDTDEIIASSNKREKYIGQKITKTFESLLKQRKSAYLRKSESVPLYIGATNGDTAFAPIVIDGDFVGGLVLFDENMMSGADKCVKLLEVGASFFAKQME